jgi:2-pyrone-4,6-dicarboxylate lactonase
VPLDSARVAGTTPSFHPSPRKPRLALPPGACDTHFHVFGPQSAFAFAAEPRFTPADAPKERLFGLHAHLGIERGVVVQSAVHGYDNSAAADLLKARPSRYLGIALVRPTEDIEHLKTLHAQGFRGARFQYMRHLGQPTPIEAVLDFARRLADIGWHLQIHLEADLLEGMSAALTRSPVPVVIDHMARLDASQGLQQKPFLHLERLLENPDIWVKVSGVERASRAGPPYADAVPFARKLVEDFGDRVLWGTDWPHPNHHGPIPDDGELVDMLAEIAPGEAPRHALLVGNPERLYGFS